MGSVGDDELHRWLRTAHVFVSMSEREAFGMAPVEAACAGARIILSDIPAHREIADEFLRRCVTVDDRRVACSDRMPRCGGSLQRRGQTTCTAPDWQDVVTRTVDVYRASGGVLPVTARVNGHQSDTESLQHEGLGR